MLLLKEVITIITKISTAIADFFINESVIEKKDRDIYIYGLELIVSNAVSLSLILMIGFITGTLLKCIVFYLVFAFMRNYTGGYHAKSYFKCEVTMVSIVIINLVFDALLADLPLYYWFLLTLFSGIIIMEFSPIDNENKPLTQAEKERNRRISLIELSIWVILIIVFAIINYDLYHIIALSLFSVSVLMAVCKSQKWGGDFRKFI